MESENFDPKANNLPPREIFNDDPYEDNLEDLEDARKYTSYENKPGTSRETIQEDENKPGPSRILTSKDPQKLQQFFRKMFGKETSPSAGEESKYLYDNSKLIIEKDGEITGLKYKRKKVVVEREKVTDNNPTVTNVNYFKRNLNNAE